MKIISWNVNGLRAVVKKGFYDFLEESGADIICLQETKAQDEQVAEALSGIDSYHIYSNSAEKKGYSGTAILTKEAPISVCPDMDIDEHDHEGRILTLEFGGFYLVNVYTPNSGSELKRLGYRGEWDRAFLSYIKGLEVKKPVIVCGDLNVAHRPVDLARPDANYNRSAGYMQAEIDGMDNMLDAGFIDSFRHLNPEKIKYSWWSYRAGARAKNIGWRIDYFLVSPAVIQKMENADILTEVTGSDHCPVSIELGTI